MHAKAVSSPDLFTLSHRSPTMPLPLEAGVPLMIDSHALLQGQRSIAIAHGEQRYILRLTRSGKLILTK